MATIILVVRVVVITRPTGKGLISSGIVPQPWPGETQLKINPIILLCTFAKFHCSVVVYMYFAHAMSQEV